VALGLCVCAACVRVCVCVCVYLHVCVCVCVSICSNTHAHEHILTYTCTCTDARSWSGQFLSLCFSSLSYRVYSSSFVRLFKHVCTQSHTHTLPRFSLVVRAAGSDANVAVNLSFFFPEGLHQSVRLRVCERERAILI